ncbi:hypothetical protein [Meiothermus taiwanensis]|uniref:Uncharacterized protein n=1 Tax=Meiothermus taiwanensis WR-220 TaxID=1339250 RepID=A0ABM6WJA4_9DEIN|nr:hypothetical protein [Meiothermus taiwanensis]AWR87255.1 hypothetical protein Mtai_v1c20220 [Meiothermus taiwanensis WR-220]
MKSLKPSLHEIQDRFTKDVLYGEVVGSTSDCGVIRLGVDAEAKISVESGALRFAPLDTPGWGRQGIAYGPFTAQAGLAFGVFMLNGHNNSQTFSQPLEAAQHPSRRQPHPSLKSPFKAHFSSTLLQENLAVGWFDHPAPARPLEAGQAFVMQGHPIANGRLCAATVQGLQHLLLDMPNIPIYFLSVLRAKGVIFYAGSSAGHRHLPALPRLRPLAIDPYDLGTPVLYAGIHQSILGENGGQADTRVYGVRVVHVPEWQGYGTALIVDPQPQLGRKAALGGVWRLEGPGMLLTPREPGGLFHVRLTAPASLIWRYRDPDHHLALELSRQEVRLHLRYGGKTYLLASEPHPYLTQDPHWVQVLDDGQALNITLDGSPLFSEKPLHEPRLGQETGVGLKGQAADLEVHPREINLPPALELGHPWQVKGQQTVFVPHLNQAAENLLLTWEPTMGPGALMPAEGGLTIEAAGLERTVYTIPWEQANFADLECEILPPEKNGKRQAQSRAGVCFWQDAQHHLVVALSLDESEHAVVAMLRLAGYEDPYSKVWTHVPDKLYFGVPVRLRAVCDGGQFQVYLDDEPVLYRALRDIYPGADRLEIRRVGLALSGYGRDTGSIFRAWVARK